MSTQRHPHHDERERIAPAEPSHAPEILIVIGGAEGGLGRWQAVVSAVARVLELELAVEAMPAVLEGKEPVDAVLERAAVVTGPVLVLPRFDAAPTAPALESPVLGRALAPFDTSDEVAVVIRPLLARLQEAGVEVAQLHVVTTETMPAMWDDSGHHARAWHAELRRRHQVGTASVEVAAGAPPAEVVSARSATVDLVVLCWKRVPHDGRAKVVRAVLSSIDVPVLLLPIA